MKIMLEKRPSKINAYGIFTNLHIPAGEKFYSIPKGATSNTPKYHCARVGSKYYCDEKVLNWINHSCNPNCIINIENLSLEAIREIKPNEEIVCDYNKTETNGNKVICNCGCKNCKGYFLAE